MPRGQVKVKGADQCDASALLHLIKYCDDFTSLLVDLEVVEKVNLQVQGAKFINLCYFKTKL